VVALASYEARAFGVHSAMPSITAKGKCPDLIFVKPRFDAYKAISLQIREIFGAYTPHHRAPSLDEAYLDVTENLKGISLATQIGPQVFSMTCRNQAAEVAARCRTSAKGQSL
jgi:DNA polymerase-4